MRWYVSQNGKASGPFPEDRIAMMVKWGKVSRGAFICDTQYSAWVAIERTPFSRLLPQPAHAPARSGIAAIVLARLLALLRAVTSVLGGGARHRRLG